MCVSLVVTRRSISFFLLAHFFLITIKVETREKERNRERENASSVLENSSRKSILDTVTDVRSGGVFFSFFFLRKRT